MQGTVQETEHGEQCGNLGACTRRCRYSQIQGECDADFSAWVVRAKSHLEDVTIDVRQASTGSVQYAPDKSAFVWKIKQLGGGREYLMRAHFGLPSVKSGASHDLGPTNYSLCIQTTSHPDHRSRSSSRFHTLRYLASKYVI